MERDIEDYLGWLRDKRGKAAQTLSTYRRILRRLQQHAPAVICACWTTKPCNIT